MRRIVVLLLIIATLAGCAANAGTATYTVDHTGGVLHVKAQDRVITSNAARGGTNSLFLFTYGDPNVPVHMFYYGTAAPGVDRVLLKDSKLNWQGGTVENGVWLITATDQDVTPDQLHYQFVDKNGAVLQEGTGTI